MPSCALVSPSLQEKVESLSSPGKEILIVSVGNKLRIGSVRGMHVHVLERGYSLWPTLLFHHPFIYLLSFDADWCPSQSLGSWAAGQLGARLWQVAGGRTRLESLLSLAVVPE